VSNTALNGWLLHVIHTLPVTAVRVWYLGGTGTEIGAGTGPEPVPVPVPVPVVDVVVPMVDGRTKEMGVDAGCRMHAACRAAAAWRGSASMLCTPFCMQLLRQRLHDN